MKKLLLTALLNILISLSILNCLAGCADVDTDDLSEINYASIVWENSKIGDTDRLAWHFLPYYGWATGINTEIVSSLSIDDLIGDSLPFNNYAEFEFQWKTDEYKVTKIEFDVTVQSTIKMGISIYNSTWSERSEVIDIQSNQTQHIIFDCVLDKVNLKVRIGVHRLYNEDTAIYTTNWKISNLFVHAEKM